MARSKAEENQSHHRVHITAPLAIYYRRENEVERGRGKNGEERGR